MSVIMCRDARGLFSRFFRRVNIYAGLKALMSQAKKTSEGYIVVCGINTLMNPRFLPPLAVGSTKRGTQNGLVGVRWKLKFSQGRELISKTSVRPRLAFSAQPFRGTETKTEVGQCDHTEGSAAIINAPRAPSTRSNRPIFCCVSPQIAALKSSLRSRLHSRGRFVYIVNGRDASPSECQKHPRNGQRAR